MSSSRRAWIGGAALGVASPGEVMAALQHAAEHMGSGRPAVWAVLTAAQAGELQALASEIIPSDSNGPGATEAGAIYFIDRALNTFHADQKELYWRGLKEVQKRRKELFPASESVAGLSAVQRVELLKSIETTAFFEALRTHVILGFVGSPVYGGNRGGVGWKWLEMEDAMAHQPPFGFYDAEAKR